MVAREPLFMNVIQQLNSILFLNCRYITKKALVTLHNNGISDDRGSKT